MNVVLLRGPRGRSSGSSISTLRSGSTQRRSTRYRISNPSRWSQNPGDAPEVRSMCSAGVDVVELEIDDSWIRDSGPIYVVDDRGHRTGIDFGFNSWGEKFLPYAADADIARRLLDEFGEQRRAVEMVLEGGAITVDGEGTLITTEQCLLNDNRNPSMDRDGIERILRATLGVESIIWLPFGGYEDAHTDGHVDGVCTFVAPGRVVAQTIDDPANPNYALMQANLEVLRTATDARGRSLDIIELPLLPYVDLDGLEVVCSYPNFYVANGGVVPPDCGLPDSTPLRSAPWKRRFPVVRVIGVPSK
ncbi:MAG: agmatine deiminase family protein [Microthrixaceae bacterium]